MATSVVMPALEMAQETGKLLKWYATEGHAVSKGDLLMSIETDKAVVDVEADASGILGGVRARDGDVIRVGQVIAWILAPGEPIPHEQDAPVSGRAHVVGAGEPAGPASAPTGGSGGDAGPVLLSPKARRLAAERGVDVRTLTGSGPGGAVVAADLEKTGPRQAREELGTVWRLMAERVTASWTTVPHFFLFRDIDAGGLQEARERFGTRADIADPRPTVTDLLVAVVARTLECRRSETEARKLLASEKFDEPEIETTLAALDSKRLAPQDSRLLSWVRDTVYYQTATIQNQTRALAADIGDAAVLEAIGVAALANATVRLAMLPE